MAGRGRGWLLALLLLLLCGAAAAEEILGIGALPEITILRDGEKVPAGRAIPLTTGALMTTGALELRKGDTLLVSDGDRSWVPEGMLKDADGLVTVFWFREDSDPPLPDSWRLLPFRGAAETAKCFALSEDESGKPARVRILSAAAAPWMENDAMLLRLSEEVRLGAPVLTEDGAVIGMIAGRYAEGPCRYRMLTLDGLTRVIERMTAGADGMPDPAPPEGLRITGEKNRYTFDWTEVSLPKKEGASPYLVISDLENSYVTYFPADREATRATLLLTPGRTYVAGILLSEEAPAELPEQYAVVAVPEAERVRTNGFRSLRFALTEDPEKAAAESREPASLTRVTEAQLRSGEAFLYSVSSYVVTERSEESLLMTLTAPDGNNYRTASGWIYDPELQTRDAWWVSLAESGLLDLLNADGYPKGMYRMDLYIDGSLADSCEFEVY